MVKSSTFPFFFHNAPNFRIFIFFQCFIENENAIPFLKNWGLTRRPSNGVHSCKNSKILNKDVCPF